MTGPIKTEFNHKFPERPTPPQCLVRLNYRPVNGRIEVRDMTFLMLPDQKLTTSLLRDLPLGKWMSQDRRKIASAAKWSLVVEGWTDEETQVLEQLAAGRRSSRGRPRLSNKTLQDVVGVYRTALAKGDPPTAAVKKELHVSRSTAGRWVGLARKQGLLGPAIERQPGEVRATNNHRGKK